MELVIAFVAGMIVLMALAELPKLEELSDKELINRMADASRKGKPAAVRQRSRYSVAGIRAK